MDTFSHGLWAGITAKGINKIKNKPLLNIKATILWGLFPDLFAFTIPFIWIILSMWTGDFSSSEFRGGRLPVAEPTGSDTLWVFQLAHILYNVSHSLVIFIIVFLLARAYYQRFRLELLGWLVHILMDIPTHTYAFFPTPIFWPLWGWEFNGFSWATPWFLLLNYSSLLLAYALLARGK